MANYGWDDLLLRVRIGSGVWTDIRSYVDEQSIAKIKAMLEDFHPKGNTYTDKKVVGTKEWDGNFELGGLYDDTATSGPDALFNNSGANIGLTGRLAESFDGTNWQCVSIINESYLAEPKQKGLTRFKVVLVPYGAPAYTATTPSGTS